MSLKDSLDNAKKFATDPDKLPGALGNAAKDSAKDVGKVLNGAKNLVTGSGGKLGGIAGGVANGAGKGLKTGHNLLVAGLKNNTVRRVGLVVLAVMAYKAIKGFFGRKQQDNTNKELQQELEVTNARNAQMEKALGYQVSDNPLYQPGLGAKLAGKSRGVGQATGMGH